MKKYELTHETKMFYGVKLTRIQRISDGALGGWVEKEGNLAQNGDAWVYGDARVFGDAQVYGDAQVFGDARVYGNARVYGDARVFGDAQVSGNAQVYGDAIKSSNDFITMKLFSYCITATKTYTQIGCKVKTNSEWKKLYKRIAKEENVSSKQVKFMKQMIEAAIKELNKRR